MACKNYDITISPLDIASATGNSNTFLNGRVFVNYPSCYGTSPTISYNTAGSYNNAVCADNEDAFNFYYYRFETSLPATNSFETEDGDCCTNIGDGFNNVVFKSIIQPDGRIIAGGSFTQYNSSVENYAVRLTPNGSKDTSFNIGDGFDTWVRTVYYQTDDKIVIGGDFTTFTGTSQNRLIRLNTDGSKDTSFNIGSGFNSTTFGVLSVAQYGTSLYVGGGFTTYNSNTQNKLIRLNSDGSKDASFNLGTGFDNSGSYVNSIYVQSDDKVLVGGTYTSFNGTTQRGLIRLNTNGSKDTSFNIGTGFSMSTIFSRNINSIVQQTDDKLLIGGLFVQYDGIPQNYLIRLNPNGTKDTSFDIGSGFNGTVRSVVIQPDGKILVGGDFTTYKGLTQRRLIRLDEFGEKDTSFDIGIGFGPLSSTQVYSINLQNDGSLIVTGAFTSYNGNPVKRIVKLSPLGTFISDCIETTPTPTPTQTQTKTPTPTPTNTQTPTNTSTTTQTPTQTKTPTQTPSTTPISCGLAGIKIGSQYYYTDCCGNFISGVNNTGNYLEVAINYNLNKGGVGLLSVPASTSCVSPTPTPTPTMTPTNTVTPTHTPTNTVTPSPSPTPSITPSNTPVTRLKNDCDVITLFEMGISCNVIQNPTESQPDAGILSINVTGGTAPYSFFWEGGQRSQTLFGVPAGSYKVVVTDYDWPNGSPDYTATTICELVGPSPSLTPTTTPTPTPTLPVQCVDLCLFISDLKGLNIFGPAQFECNGTKNGQITWFSNNTGKQLYIIWSPVDNRWVLYIDSNGTIPFIINESVIATEIFESIPLNGWQFYGGLQSGNIRVTEGVCPEVVPLQIDTIPTNSSCGNTGPQGATGNNCHGSIAVIGLNGVPPYTYSINGGIPTTSNNLFTNLCPNTYSVSVYDSAGSSQDTSVSIGYDSLPVTYQLSLLNDGPATITTVPNVSQTVTQQMILSVTPPLPVGLTVTFDLLSTVLETFNTPGSSGIVPYWTVSKNGSPISVTTTPLTTVSSGIRPFCPSPAIQLIQTLNNSSNITIMNGDIITINATTINNINDGQVSVQTNCTTNVKSEISAIISEPIINGNNCSSVIGSSRDVLTNDFTFVPVVVVTPLNFDVNYTCNAANPLFADITITNIVGGTTPYQVGGTVFTSQTAALANTSWVNDSTISYEVRSNNLYWVAVKDSNGNILTKSISVVCSTRPAQFDYDLGLICGGSLRTVSLSNIRDGVSPYLIGATYFTTETAALANNSWFPEGTVEATYGVPTTNGMTLWFVVKDSAGTVLVKSILSNC